MHNSVKWMLWLVGLLVVLHGTGANAPANEPRPRAVWYAYVADGRQYGYEKVAVTRQEDGNFRYDVERRILFDLLGQRQETTQRAKYVVTATYQPVSLDREDRQQSGRTQITGQAQAGRFAVTYEREGLTRRQSFDLTRQPLFQVCIDDWLAGQTGDVARCRVLNETALELESAVFKRRETTESGFVWEADFGMELGRGELTFDADGIRSETKLSVPRMHLRRISAEQAKNIRHHRYEGGEILMFPVDPPIAAPQRLENVTIRLNWRGVPLKEFQLTDDRQRIVDYTQTGDEHTVVLQIGPVQELDAAVTFPVEGDEFAPLLGESRYIRPLDPAVARQARAWIGEGKSAAEAVQALSTGVFDHLQGGSLIVETLTGPEVLHCKEGKCSEFSILFASLTRSIGIPTRIVLGMRLVDNSWVGHMWNEVYVGRWVTVDTTANEVGDAPVLLKLVQSDTVWGTQSLRWAVADSLRISVVDHQLRPAAIAEGLKTGIDGLVYVNAESGCRMTAPDKSWLLKEVKSSGPQPPIVRFQIPDEDDVNIHFVVLNVPAAFTPKVLIDIRKARFKAMYKEYEVLKHEERKVREQVGQLFVFRRAGGESEGETMKTTEVLWSDGTTCYLLNLIAEEAAHHRFEPAFFKLLDGFETLSRPE
jgi:hypothetical protein